jgi:hypothetical protein
VSDGTHCSAGRDTLRGDSHQVLIVTRFLFVLYLFGDSWSRDQLLLYVAEFHE